MDRDDVKTEWSSILQDGQDLPPTEAVLRLLSEYSGLSVEGARALATDSSRISKEKWDQSDRSTPESINAFYQDVSNWVFGTISYHARQAESGDDALPVLAASDIGQGRSRDHLDFGCGVATASLLFSRMGWRVSVADISRPLLDFARWRLDRAKVPAKVIDLNTDAIGVVAYDLITAFNTMAHVTSIKVTLQSLARALRPGGLLVFDIDSRVRDTGNEWFLYPRHSMVLRWVRRLGFVRNANIGPLYVYERRTFTPLEIWKYTVIDELKYSPPAQTLKSILRRWRFRDQRVA